jgi:hypothetical protein
MLGDAVCGQKMYSIAIVASGRLPSSPGAWTDVAGRVSVRYLSLLLASALLVGCGYGQPKRTSISHSTPVVAAPTGPCSPSVDASGEDIIVEGALRPYGEPQWDAFPIVPVSAAATLTASLATAPVNSPYSVELDDCQGAVIATARLPLPPSTPSPRSCGSEGCAAPATPLVRFAIAFPFRGNIARAAVRYRGAVIAVHLAPGAPPACNITSPRANTVIRGSFVLTWDCVDPNVQLLNVLASADGNALKEVGLYASWPAGRNSVHVDLAEAVLRPSNEHEFQLSAEDGFYRVTAAPILFKTGA